MNEQGNQTAEKAPEDRPPIQMAAPVTLSGLIEDLCIHTHPRKNAPLWRYMLRLLVAAMLSSGFHMVALYRLGAFCHKFRLYPVCIVIEKIIYHWYHCLIPCSVKIGPALWVPHPLGIVLNSRARLGKYVRLRQGVEIVHIMPEDRGKSGLVGDRVQLNSGALLIRGAVIAEDSIVAARAVVNGYVPPAHIAVGIPATYKPMRDEHLEQARSRDPACTSMPEDA